MEAGDARIAELKPLRGEDFDRKYLALAGVKAHTDAVALYEHAASQASDADIKAFAAKELTTIKRHLHQASELLQPTTGDAGSGPVFAKKVHAREGFSTALT